MTAELLLTGEDKPGGPFALGISEDSSDVLLKVAPLADGASAAAPQLAPEADAAEAPE